MRLHRGIQIWFRVELDVGLGELLDFWHNGNGFELRVYVKQLYAIRLRKWPERAGSCFFM